MAVVYEGPLPKDLMIEVLSWLPVKTLLQFKSVCKSWYAIITSPHFISKHMNNYCNDKNGRLLVRYVMIANGVDDLIELFQDETLVDLSHQRFEPPMDGNICGPLDGIFFLNYSTHLRDSGLWNPATREFKLLPKKITKPNLPPDVFLGETFGFGLDPVTNDYKVVIIQNLWLDLGWPYPSSVIVYTLSTDAWKYWGELTKPYILRHGYCYTYVNGVYYWLAGEDCHWSAREIILSFDMATEIFQEIQLPECDKPANETLGLYYGLSATLGLYYGSIALFTIHPIQKFLDIWVMNEGCWIKQFTVGPFSGFPHLVGYGKSGEVFLKSNTQELMWYNPISQEIKDLEFQGDYILIYNESLVSIKDRIGCSQHEEV